MGAAGEADDILELLYDRREGFVSPAELAAAAGGAAAAQRLLAQVERRGHRLERSPYGLRLVRPARPATRLIERGLPVRRVGRSVLCFDEVDSTNDVALAALGRGGQDGLVVLAEHQRRGRGRHGRGWLSPPGQNVLMTVLLVEGDADGAAAGGAPSAAPLRDEAVTIAAGVAAAEGIETAFALSCELKWPNDVLLEGAKTAGVLAEARRQGRVRGLAIGIGINANACPQAPVDRPATCLADRLGHSVERVELVRRVLVSLDGWIARLRAGELAELHRAFLSRCTMVGRRVTARYGGQAYAGLVLDIDPLEGLVVGLDDGMRMHLPAAGTTVE